MDPITVRPTENKDDRIDVYPQKDSLFLMGRDQESRDLFFDAGRRHVVAVAGKTRSGKSYLLGTLVEGNAAARPDLAQVIIDPTGSFLALNEPNEEAEKDLAEWDLKPRGLDKVMVFVPGRGKGENRGLTFPLEVLCPDDLLFFLGIEEQRFGPMGLMLAQCFERLRENGGGFSMKDLREEVMWSDKEGEEFAQQTRRGLQARLKELERIEIFQKQGTGIRELLKPGWVSVVDLSPPGLGWETKVGIAGLLCRLIFDARISSLRGEGIKVPPVLLVVDEAHLFAPKGKTTRATASLVDIAKLGRHPGISLVLATQRPAATSDEILSQVDTVFGFKLCLKEDINNLFRMSPVPVQRERTEAVMRSLPVGHCLYADEEQDKWLELRIRPRLSKPGGKDRYAEDLGMVGSFEEDEPPGNPSEIFSEPGMGKLFNLRERPDLVPYEGPPLVNQKGSSAVPSVRFLKSKVFLQNFLAAFSATLLILLGLRSCGW